MIMTWYDVRYTSQSREKVNNHPTLPNVKYVDLQQIIVQSWKNFIQLKIILNIVATVTFNRLNIEDKTCTRALNMVGSVKICW